LIPSKPRRLRRFAFESDCHAGALMRCSHFIDGGCRSHDSHCKILLAALAAITLTLSAANVLAQKDPEVGGAAMFPSKNIVQNAVNSPDHTTLVAAVKAGGLVDTLSGPGPFTVFAPTNEAFAKLPEGTVDTLLKPENKDQLVKILTYHVVAGKVSSKDLIKHDQEGRRQS
jgi:uncharacterized surface protein with fasciclin (FAS1) repeats